MWKVNLILSQSNLPNLVDKRCMGCGNLMFKLNRDTLVIWMGEEWPPRLVPLGMGWFQHKCKSCPTIYNVYFQ